MPALLLYLLKVNVALLLFYLAYHLVLRRLTFYQLNRKFLLFGILFSTVYPFIDITPLLSRHQELPVVYFATVPTWTPPAEVAAATPAFDYWQLPVWLFWLGTGVMAVRLVLQFVSLYKIHAASVPDSHNGISFRKVWSITQAFSFWQNIYLNPSQHRQEELEPILRHEQVHVREWHTLDVLLAEISAVFYWFNPGAWLMKKGIKENLEFIADQDVVRAGADRKEYQYLLLKATGATEPQLALPFSFPSLKRRIAMLNKMPTRKANRLRLLVVLPIVAVLLLAFRSVSQSIESNEPGEQVLSTAFNQQIDDVVEQHKAFYKRNPEVKKIFWKSTKEIVIRLETEEEIYQLNDKKSMAAAEKKYGKLPSAPLPAKVITEAQAASKAGIIDLENGDKLLTPSDRDYYQDKNNLPVAYTNFLKKNPSIDKIGWKVREPFAVYAIVIYFKSGASETYTLQDSRSIAAAEAKYGKLPEMLPPAPPVVVASVVNPRDKSNRKLPQGYADFLKLNPKVDHVASTFNAQEELESFTIFLKSGDREKYVVNDSKSKTAASAKYRGISGLLAQPSPIILVELKELKSADQQDQTFIPSKSEEPADYKAFLNRNPQVKQVGWKGSKKNVLVIFLNSGATEMYNLLDEKSRYAAEQKYGKLPMLPPPPPPAAPGRKALPPPPPAAPVAPPAPPVPPAQREKGNASRFPGGEKAMFEYVFRNMKYPRAAINANVQGNSIVEFTVEKDGSITDIKIINTPHESIGAEIIKLIGNMPKWNPATDDDPQPVFTYKLPVKLSLSGDSGREREMPGAPPAPPRPVSGWFHDSGKIIAYQFDPHHFTEEEFVAVQKLFSKHGCQVTFDNKYKGKELTQLKLSATSQWGSVSGTYDVQEMKRTDYSVLLKIDKEKGSIVVASSKPRYPSGTTAPAQSAKAAESLKPVMYVVAEKDASRFPGGSKALYDYIRNNIRYPFSDFSENVQGKAEIKFTVDKDGKISNPQIVEAPHDFIARQLINLVNKMPGWLPAKANDPQPGFTYSFTVDYKLEERSK